jgi:hypothetical protein
MSTSSQLLTALGSATPNKADLIALLTKLAIGPGAFGGLLLRTHPDTDRAAAEILMSADFVVMNDGEVVPGWGLGSASLAASGADGLDTGSEQASTWYELHAIRKSSDGTKARLFHRAKDYFVDSGQQFVTAVDAARALRLSTGTATDKLAQGFQSTTTGVQGPIEIIFIPIDRDNAIAAGKQIWLTIEADSSGNPSGTPLATSDKLDASVVNTAIGYFAFVFRAPFTPAEDTQYHLVLQGDYDRSDTVVIKWSGVAAGGYANGSAKQFNGSSWSAASGVGDFDFQVYTSRNIVGVASVLPAGYDQYALLGWAYNDGSSNLRPFIARDRLAKQTLVASGNVTTAVPTPIDFRAALPPVPVMAIVTAFSSVADDQAMVGGVPGLSGHGTVPNDHAHIACATANVEFPGGALGTEVPWLYVARFAGTGNVNVRVRGFHW